MHVPSQAAAPALVLVPRMQWAPEWPACIARQRPGQPVAHAAADTVCCATRLRVG